MKLLGALFDINQFGYIYDRQIYYKVYNRQKWNLNRKQNSDLRYPYQKNDYRIHYIFIKR